MLKGIFMYMIEGMYFKLIPNDYIDFIEHYKSDFDLLPEEQRNLQLIELKEELSIILSEPNIDYIKIMVSEAGHALLTQEDTKQIFILIWKCFINTTDETQ